MIAVRFCLVISKCQACLRSFPSTHRWASQETLMTLQTFRLGFFQSSPTTQSHAVCSMPMRLSLRWAHKGIQLLVVRLDMPSLRSRPVFKWLHLSFRWIWNGSFASIDAGLCMFLSCEFLLFCPSNYPAIMLPGVDCLNEKWCPKCLALRPTFSVGLKERERSIKQWSTKINQIMWNKYYCNHVTWYHIIVH